MAIKEMTRFLWVLFLTACVATSRVRGPLLEQELRFRPQGLTNQVCTLPKLDGTCEQMDRVVYDLSDPQTRERLIGVKLICNVAGVRFRIMKDEPCLYRAHERVKRFIGIPTKRELIIDEKICVPESLGTLLDRNTYCAPLGSASERGMKWN